MRNRLNINSLNSGNITALLTLIVVIQSIIILVFILYILQSENDKIKPEIQTVENSPDVVIESQNDIVTKNNDANTNNSDHQINKTITANKKLIIKSEPIIQSESSDKPINQNIESNKDKPNDTFFKQNNAIPNFSNKEVAINNVTKIENNENSDKKIPKIIEKPIENNTTQNNVKAKSETNIKTTTPIKLNDKKPENNENKNNIAATKNIPKQAEEVKIDFEIPEIKDDTGAFVQRSTIGRNEGVQLSGGSIQSENAVDMALAWLAIHQEPDGHWDSGKYEGTATMEFDLAVTGAAILAFLSAGQTDIKGEWSLAVKMGLKWLMKNQKKNGSFDNRNYTNGICTMAICEAAAMGCGGEELKKSAVLAINFILKQQNENGCFDYTGITKRNDMSVTGWCITALKSGALAGINRKEIGEAYEKLKLYLETAEGTKDITPESKGLAWYTPDKIGSGVAGGACQSIAMFVSQQIGKETTTPSPWLIAAADGQIAKMPTKYIGGNANVYRIYYTYLTLRQYGGKHWQTWNEKVSLMIISAQRQDGDFRGSWDLNGSSIDKAGRVMYTAFLCLCLEIYYRYPTVF